MQKGNKNRIIYLRKNATLLQILDPLVTQTQPLPEDFIRVLAKQWRGRSDTGVRVGVFDGGVENLDRAADGVLDLFDHAACDGYST